MMFSDDIFMKINKTLGVTLKSGVDYKAGMVVTLQNDGEYTNDDVINPEDTPAGTQLPFSEQTVGILREDIDATTSSQAGVIVTDGSANLNKVVLPGSQVVANIAGTLQAKNLELKGWNK